MRPRHNTGSPSDHTASPSCLSLPPVPLRVKRHSLSAWVPTRGSLHATGYNLYSAEVKMIPACGWSLIKTIPACGWSLVNTELSVMVPPGTYGWIALHSGLATKFSINAGVGIVDSDYRGLVYILLLNHSNRDFQVNIGDHIAQLILEHIATPLIAKDPKLDGAISTPLTPSTLNTPLSSNDPCPKT